VLGHLIPAHAFLLIAVEVAVAHDAGTLCCVDEMVRERVRRAQVADVQRPGAAVKRIVVLAGQTRVALGAAEIRQHVVPRPAVAAGIGPGVVVGRAAARVDHGGDQG
jgi:hypothetical protein